MKQGCSFPASTSRPIWRLDAASWLLVSNALGQGNIARQLSVLPFFKGEDGVQHPGQGLPQIRQAHVDKNEETTSIFPILFPCLFPVFAYIKSINMCPIVSPCVPICFPCFLSSLTMLVRFLFQPVAVCFLCLVDVFRSILMFGSLFTQFPFGGS